jgi:hypothetical protein
MGRLQKFRNSRNPTSRNKENIPSSNLPPERAFRQVPDRTIPNPGTSHLGKYGSQKPSRIV